MKVSIKEIKHKGEPCIKMTAGKYTALLAPTVGSNMLRLRDNKNNIEMFHFDVKAQMKFVKKEPLFFGLPTLYLPNQLSDGILKTSDAIYKLPINEPKRNNHIHGFLHLREFKVIHKEITDTSAIVKTQYIYNSDDDFYQYLPIDFKAEIIFTLTDKGLFYQLELTNNSDKMMPVGVATPTALQCPFSRKHNKLDYALSIPAKNKCELNNRHLSSTLADLGSYDEKYLTGNTETLENNIDDDMYLLEKIPLKNGYYKGFELVHTESEHKVCCEVSKEYDFIIVGNFGRNHRFISSEPTSWMINAPNITDNNMYTGYREIAPNKKFTAKQYYYSV